ncbi:ATP-binding cassette domain-containing protein, partial [Saccharomonospora iraqiensis]|uniref:ATP-binding cassette domain-containing protein n=1 Tax=Saccharomonospora iraqiensis TaxID=52698 RepID=UPI0012F93F2B
ARAAMRDDVEAQAAAAVRMGAATATRILVVSVGAFVPLLLVLFLAPGMVAAGTLTQGAVLATVVYLSTTLQPALQGLAATTSTVVLRLLVALRRLAECGPAAPDTAAPDAVAPDAATPDTAAPDGTREPHGEAAPDQGAVSDGEAVRLRGVTFEWGAGARPVVEDFDLDLVPGDHLAVVGPSGIGKSTLAGLITGTVRPRRGRVLLGGVDVAGLRPRCRRERIAFSPQEAYLFAGTVRQNLALLAPGVDDAALYAAADAVGAGPLLARLG